MKQILPNDIDITDYDTEDFKKQLELETVRIKLVKETHAEAKPQDFKREVTREENQTGKFDRLQRELLNMSQEFKVDLE